MHQWRITKYDPRLRDDGGAYTGTDWTSATDVGKTLSGHQLGLEEYLATEDRYVSAAGRFLQESQVSSLVVAELEPAGEVPGAIVTHGLDNILHGGPDLTSGLRLDSDDIALVCRLNLRSLVWCRLEEPSKFFIHFGHDYYMYIGSSTYCPESISYAESIELFVEEGISPYAVEE